MDILLALLVGIALGFSGGLLVFRKHRQRIDALEAEARQKAEAIKNALK